MASVHLKYLAVNPVDLKWGTAVNSVGFQEIAPGMDYPPRNHPSRYVFSVASGRILQEYQLLYMAGFPARPWDGRSQSRSKAG